MSEKIAAAEKIAVEFYQRIKNKLGRRALNRVTVEDLKQEAVVFVLERADDTRMVEPEYFERNVINCLRRYIYRECQIADTEVPLNQFEHNDTDKTGRDTGSDYNPVLEDKRPFTNPAQQAVLNEVLTAVDSLQTKQREVIAGKLRRESGESMSMRLGISHQAISERYRNGINSLRLALGVA